MTAIACLRILIDSDRARSGGEHLATLVNKVAGAYLETRWLWPRRHGEIAPYAFLLVDPRAMELNPAELTALSDELQAKLFGASGGGAISMAMLEGEQDMVTRFAAVDTAILRKVLSEGGTIEGLIGRISEITGDGIRVVSPPDQAGPLQPVAPAAAPTRHVAPPPKEDLESSYRAIWCSLKDSIIGSGLVARRKGARAFYSTMDGPAETPPAPAAADFDITCLEAAPRALWDSQGLLFLPISFSSAVSRSARESYLEMLEALPQSERSRLAAAVYDVPRAPSFAAVRQLQAFVNPYFSFVDLQTSDPGFQVEALMLEAVNSVTLTLPDLDEGSRMVAVSRFMANKDAYQRRRIWPAVTNVRSRRELEFCAKLRVPFLSGKAVCDHLEAPADPARCTIDRLPLRETIMMPNPQRLSAAN
jgi:pimeloyl-ACP methyl ester carboxylesterase